jgi:quercetin dioxygenase-like cupin family protein
LKNNNEGSNNPSEVFKPKDLLNYQGGSVVSRTLTKGPNGSVTVFAFDKGQELSEHTVPFNAVVCVLDGEVEIKISGVAHRITAGEAILMPANEPHAVKALEKFKMLLSMVKKA